MADFNLFGETFSGVIGLQLTDTDGNDHSFRDVVMREKSITENGVYEPNDDGVDGYNRVTVNVSGGGGGGSDAEDGIIARTISGSYANSRVTQISGYAFYSCTSLTEVSFPSCTTIGYYAFRDCTSLTTINFPVCTSIYSYAFGYCYSLTTASFPACTSIGSYAFVSCSSLTTASFPACTSIGSYAFGYCRRLLTVSFTSCRSIGASAFIYCSSLTAVSFPSCTWIGSSAFASCYSLTTASFPACTGFGSYAFGYCRKLLSAYFLGSSVPTMGNSNAFISTPIAGYTTSTGGVYGSIYVRASLLATFQSSTNWTYFSSRMVGLTDAQIAEL